MTIALLLLAVCPLRLIEPTGDYDQWWKEQCCVDNFGRACFPGFVPAGGCGLRPNWPGVTVHELRHVGPAPDQTVVGFDWLPLEAGTWIVDREVRIDGVVARIFQWQQVAAEACSQPAERPLFADGFESGDTSAWSRAVIRLGPGIFSNGFEEGDVSAWE